jgi:hypothetical protein
MWRSLLAHTYVSRTCAWLVALAGLAVENVPGSVAENFIFTAVRAADVTTYRHHCDAVHPPILLVFLMDPMA